MLQVLSSRVNIMRQKTGMQQMRYRRQVMSRKVKTRLTPTSFAIATLQAMVQLMIKCIMVLSAITFIEFVSMELLERDRME